MNKKLLIILSSFNLMTVSASEIQINVTNEKGEPIENAVAYISSTTSNNEKQPLQLIDQQDREFIPYVTVIQKGQSINFPNNDQIRHQVYSFSEAKQFEIPLYKGNPQRPVTFDKAGVVAIGCNIHDWMQAYIYVVDTPYFSTSDANGIAIISGLNNGDYTINLWHPTLKSEILNQKISIVSQTASLNFKIEQKAVFRAWRAPRSQGGRY